MKTRHPSPRDTQKRFDDAERSLERIERTIEPYVSPRPFTRVSTTGKWRLSESTLPSDTDGTPAG